jgi:hypothetical protein
MAVISRNSAFFVQKLLEKTLLSFIIFQNWKHYEYTKTVMET